jgi:hypothetical protein
MKLSDIEPERPVIGLSRRTFCVLGVTAVVVCPLGFAEPREAKPRLLTISSLVTDRTAATRLGRLCMDALGAAAAIALVQEQERRIAQEAPDLSRASIEALIRSDFRAGRVVDVNGLRLSRLEGAVLIASCADELATTDVT